MKPTTCILILGLCLVIANSADCQEAKKLPPAPDGVTIEQDIAYLEPGSSETGDLYLPAKRAKGVRSPAVVIIHGGGWTGGDKAAAREFNIGTTLALNGYVAISINYVLATKDKATWPQNLHDCMTAVRWLRKNANRLQIDPDRIGAIGGSAGGHLAAMVGVLDEKDGLDPKGPYGEFSCRVQCAVPMYGPMDLTEHRDISMLGKTRDQAPELYRTASPVTYVRKSTPPMLILHGTADKTVDIKQSELFAAALKKVGAAHELVIVDGAPHTFHLQPKQRDLRPVVLGFFETHLTGAKDTKTTGVVIGVLIERTPGKGVLVKADGEEAPRRYWRFGDRPALNKEIDAVPLLSRVRLTWEIPHANEGPHVAKIEVLKNAGKEESPRGGDSKALDETLAWLKSLPTMSGSAIGPKKERDCFRKLTAADLKSLKELHIGGHIIKDGKFQPGHVELPAEEYRHLVVLAGLEKLGFMENGLGDSALVHVGKLENLTHLTFGDHAITDAGLNHLASLKKLTYLNLCFPDKKHGGIISDKGMDAIAKLTSLETLDLRATQITDAGLAKVKTLPKLKELLLNNTAITDAGLVNLESAKTLRVVNVFNCKSVTPKGIAQLRKALPECEVRTTKAN